MKVKLDRFEILFLETLINKELLNKDISKDKSFALEKIKNKLIK